MGVSAMPHVVVLKLKVAIIAVLLLLYDNGMAWHGMAWHDPSIIGVLLFLQSLK